MRALALAFIACMLAVPVVHAEPPYVPVEQRLSAQEMRATGLDTLSPEQLQLLNRLLREERSQAVTAAVEQRERDEAGLRHRRPAPEAVSGAVQGTVRGWSRGDVVVLQNGQRWRVTDGSLVLRNAAVDPKVTIEPGMFGAWYLQMEGQTPKLKVQRVD
jgi:hypothetical protein